MEEVEEGGLRLRRQAAEVAEDAAAEVVVVGFGSWGWIGGFGGGYWGGLWPAFPWAAPAGDRWAGPGERRETRGGRAGAGWGRERDSRQAAAAVEVGFGESLDHAEREGEQVDGGELDAVGDCGVGEFEQAAFDFGVAAAFGEEVEGGEAVVVGLGVCGEVFEGAEVEGVEDCRIFEVGGGVGVVGVEVGEELGAPLVEPAEVVLGGGHVGDCMRTGVLVASFGGVGWVAVWGVWWLGGFGVIL